MDKEEFLEKAMQANKDAVDQAKLSDLTDKDSAFYVQKPETKIEETVQTVERAPDEIPRIRTFNADVADAVANETLSLSKVALAESKKKQEAPDEPSKKISPFVLISTILTGMMIIGGVLAVGYVWYQKNKPATPENILPTETSFVRFDEKTDLVFKNISTRSIAEEVSKEMKKPSEKNGLRKINFFTENDSKILKLDTTSLLSSLEAKVPEELTWTLSNEFFFGIYFDAGTPTPILILKGETYETLFPRLLAYENNMLTDLLPLFGSKDTKISFSDKIILNRDTRAIVKDDSSVDFFYTIYDNTYVIMTTRSQILEEVLKRFREKK